MTLYGTERVGSSAERHTPDANAPDSAIVVGLMSGTSCDGISAAAVRFSRSPASGRLEAELMAFVQRPFSITMRERLLAASVKGTAQEYCLLDVDLGHLFADAANAVLAETDVWRSKVTAIACHGHTLWHEPGRGSWQAVGAAVIAERTSCTVISDFRSRDIAAGGQGAPLVPMADVMLFADETRWCALQNIGGIGNISVVPPFSTGESQLDGVRAFDTGPGTVLVDDLVRTLFPGLAYDVDGRIAANGKVIGSAVRKALSHGFFSKEPPKSTGRELFTHEFTLDFIADCRGEGGTDADIVATGTALTAASIVDQYDRFIAEPVERLLLSGGGARNPALVDAIRNAFLDRREQSDVSEMRRRYTCPSIELFSDCFFDGDAKEAVAFALLGYLTLQGESGNVPSATGARGARTLGAIVAV